MKSLPTLILLLLSTLAYPIHSSRTIASFDEGWKFFYGDQKGAENPEFQDRTWRSVDVPHDYSIEDLPPIKRSKAPTLIVSNGEWKFQLGDDLAWKEPAFDDLSWQSIVLPAHWSSHVKGDFTNKFGWYRRRFSIPSALRGKDLILALGKIDDVDETYVNGVKVGGMGSLPPNYLTAWSESRNYSVPAKLLKGDGTDLVAVRDYNGAGDAGLYESSSPVAQSGPFDSVAEGGSGQGYTRGSVAWYRKSFRQPASAKNKSIWLTFDGVYMNATFWLNGHKLGDHPYGYTSFSFDLKPYLHPGQSNVLAVRVDSTGRTSRWYSGSGIYRHVWLTTTQSLHIKPWGVYVTTPTVSEHRATVRVRTEISNQHSATLSAVLTSKIFDARGEIVATSSAPFNVSTRGEFQVDQDMAFERPRLWSPERPTLYRIVSTLTRGTRLEDSVQTSFGVRSLSFDAVHGFLLNGRALKLRGGCVHHDNGPLGACTYDRAEVRRVELLKSAGYNAIRTSHNPPSPAFLDACDRLGMLVLDEAFDCWRNGKNTDDYHKYFDAWWKRDIDSMVHRDRNHPSVILWSIGNEIPEQNDHAGAVTGAKLADEVRRLDPTRPVTEATNPYNDNLDPLLAHLDVTGYNYEARRFAADERKHPGRVFMQTESFPGACLESWNITVSHPYVVGDFVWTALDYIGEAGIGRVIYKSDNGGYASTYPCTVSGCGDLDLTGVRKPQSWYRGVVWSSHPEVTAFVDAVPDGEPGYQISGWGWPDDRASWTWPGREGKKLTVRVYANTPKVKLTLNSTVVGVSDVDAKKDTATFTVPYHPGRLTAEALDSNGNSLAKWSLQTTSSANQIRLTPDRSILSADGQDLSFISVDLLDSHGRQDPNATQQIQFHLSGPAKIVGVANGNPYSVESNQRPLRRAFQGHCLVIVKTMKQAGTIRLTATSPGLLTAKTSLTSLKK